MDEAMKKEHPPKIVVISLARATERRRAITQQMSHLGLDYEFFDAVDGVVGHPLFSLYDPQAVTAIGGKPMTHGQLGCFASHYILWQHSVERNESIIVLEDDACLHPVRFMNFLKLLPYLPSDIECIRLFENKSRNSDYWPILRLKSFNIGKFMRGHVSTTGYYLTPSAASRFLDYCKVWTEPVDRLVDHFWANGVECYGVDPPCLTHNATMDSFMTWGDEQKRKRALRSYLRWRSYQWRLRLRRVIHNFRFMLRQLCPRAQRQVSICRSSFLGME